MPRFFLTNRAIRSPRSKPAEFIGEPGDVSYVIAPDDATTLSPADRLTRAGRASRWAKAIRDAADDGDGCGDVIFLVHGYNVDAQDAFKTHKELEDNIGSALRAAGISKPVFVTFSWPAQGSFFNYLEDDQDARRAALDLITSGLALFAAFTEPGCRIKTHVMAHSMGALVVREALRASVGHTPTREAAWSITNLIFYGADISRGSLNRKEGRRLLEKSQTFTNYFSRDDAALQTSNAKRALFSPRLGAVGAPDDVTPLVSDIDMTDHWLSIKDTNDDRLFADIPFSHTFYRSDPVFARDVAMVIRGMGDVAAYPGRDKTGDRYVLT